MITFAWAAISRMAVYIPSGLRGATFLLAFGADCA